MRSLPIHRCYQLNHSASCNLYFAVTLSKIYPWHCYTNIFSPTRELPSDLTHGNTDIETFHLNSGRDHEQQLPIESRDVMEKIAHTQLATNRLFWQHNTHRIKTRKNRKPYYAQVKTNFPLYSTPILTTICSLRCMSNNSNGWCTTLAIILKPHNLPPTGLFNNISEENTTNGENLNHEFSAPFRFRGTSDNLKKIIKSQAP